MKTSCRSLLTLKIRKRWFLEVPLRWAQIKSKSHFHVGLFLFRRREKRLGSVTPHTADDA